MFVLKENNSVLKPKSLRHGYVNPAYLPFINEYINPNA